MSRPVKQTVDYFPHMVAHKRTMFVIEGKWGNDGYAFWFKLLEILGASEKHVFDCGNPTNWEFLLAKTRIDDQTAREILGTLAVLEAIDRELWQKSKIIWCQKFVDNLFAVYEKRRKELPSRPKPSCSDELSTPETPGEDGFRPENEGSAGVSGSEIPDNSASPENDSFRPENGGSAGVSGVRNPHSRVERSRVENREVEGSRGSREEGEERTAVPPSASPPEVHSPPRKTKPQKPDDDIGSASPGSAPESQQRSKPRDQQLAELAEVLSNNDPEEYKKFVRTHPEFAEGPIPIDSS